MPGQPRRVDEEVYEDDREDVVPGTPAPDQPTEGVADAHVPLDGDGDDHVDRAVVGNVAEMVQAGHKVCKKILDSACAQLFSYNLNNLFPGWRSLGTTKVQFQSDI